MSTDRRGFLQQAGLASVGLLGLGVLPKAGMPAAKGSWSFIHFTDVHVQPELRADEGYRQAVRAMNNVKPKPALAIAGGDLVFDVFETGFERADKLYMMYSEITQGLDMPVHQTIGNHDIFGIDPAAGVSENHPEHGKKMFASRVGNDRTYRSFDFLDWHFVLLDSLFVTPELGYEGRIDQQQFDWLQNDLKSVGAQRPMVLVSHIPFFSILPMILNGPTEAVSPSLTITNSKEVLGFCSDYNVRLILQGHVHIVENHQYKKTEYVTSGAVCGNWWKGPRMGHPEGFAVYTVDDDRIQWSYHSFGWRAVDTG
jgi:Icc protein